MGTSYHLCMEIDKTLEMCNSRNKNERRKIQSIWDAGIDEITRECFRKQKEGKTHMTGCDNENAEGKCGGHNTTKKLPDPSNLNLEPSHDMGKYVPIFGMY